MDGDDRNAALWSMGLSVHIITAIINTIFTDVRVPARHCEMDTMDMRCKFLVHLDTVSIATPASLSVSPLASPPAILPASPARSAQHPTSQLRPPLRYQTLTRLWGTISVLPVSGGRAKRYLPARVFLLPAPVVTTTVEEHTVCYPFDCYQALELGLFGVVVKKERQTVAARSELFTVHLNQ